MKKFSLLFIILLTTTLVFTGCLTTSQLAALQGTPDFAKSPILDSQPLWRTVILPPASANTSYLFNADGLDDFAGIKLLRTGKFSIIDRSLVDLILHEQEFSYSGIVDPASAVRLGSLLGAEAVMTITIGQIRHDDFWDDEPAQRTASLHVKLISVETSEVLYTSAGEGSSFEGAEGALNMALEMSLIGLTQ